MPLLDALRAVVDLAVEDPADADHFGPDRAESLLASPLAGLDATEVRALARALRAREKRALAQPRPGRGGPAAPTRIPTVEPGAAETPPAGRGPPRSCSATRCSTRDARGDARARRGEGAGAGPAAAAAAPCSTTAPPPRRCSGCCGPAPTGPRRLRRGVDLGGQAARLAHRDLDAICALFETAARAEEQRGHTSVANFLATAARPADPRRHPRRAGRARRRRPAAHRPPLQGPGVAARGGRARPGGRLARPAAALHAAAAPTGSAPTACCRR